MDSDAPPCAVAAQRSFDEVPAPDIVVVPGSRESADADLVAAVLAGLAARGATWVPAAP